VSARLRAVFEQLLGQIAAVLLPGPARWNARCICCKQVIAAWDRPEILATASAGASFLNVPSYLFSKAVLPPFEFISSIAT